MDKTAILQHSLTAVQVIAANFNGIEDQEDLLEQSEKEWNKLGKVERDLINSWANPPYKTQLEALNTITEECKRLLELE